MAKTFLGREFQFLVDLATSETQAGENWALVSAQKEGGFEYTNDMVDTTTKDDFGFSTDAIITKRWVANFSGNYDPMNPAIDLLIHAQQDILNTDYKIKVKFREASGVELVGFARVESFTPTTPVDGIADYSISLKGQGSYELR